MYGISDRMVYWPRVKQALNGVPVRRVWEIFNKMLLDREKFIIGNGFYGTIGYGFLWRRQHLRNFIGFLTDYMKYRYGVYPPYPAQSGLPVLDSYAKIEQYAAAKYPDMHTDNFQYWLVDDYHPEQCYMTADAGGDDDYAFLHQTQLFEKLWNFLHYFGGLKLYDKNRRYGIPYWETNGFYYDYPGPGYSYLSQHGFRFMYTPSDNMEYKYICLGYAVSWASGNGIVAKPGWNILYESDWMRGPFTSPLLIQNSGTYFEIVTLNMNVYPRWPDFYDPETLEPVYF